MKPNLPEGARSAYARQLADEAKTLVPGMERLAEIAAELRADDLYRTLGFDTWERFCVDYLGVTKRTANRWIAGPSKPAAVSASDIQRPKSITAGQRVAPGQNVPVVESTALKSSAPTEAPAKKSEGSGQGAEVSPRSLGLADAERHPDPSDPSPVGGNALGEVSAPPTGVPRPPTDRALTARVVAAMRDIDPTDAGSVTTPEEATFLRQWAQRTLDAWKAKNVPVVAPRPAGRVIKPGDRKAKAEAVAVPLRGKRHADDCSCLSCAPPKEVRA